MDPTTGSFPRLLYIGDIPIESTTGGSALIFRLLLGYPRQHLRIVESNFMARNPATRLEGVNYQEYGLTIRRLLTTRWAPRYCGHLFRRAPAQGASMARRVIRQGWRPQAVLTVAHRRAWIVADCVAQSLGIPLHFIIHDDPFLMAYLPESMRPEFDRAFADVFRRAASRLCVSPFMAETYKKQFGVETDVVYPSRPPRGLEFDEPPRQIGAPSTCLTYAYAGTINSDAYGLRLSRLAAILGPRGDRLEVFSNLAPASVEKFGLNLPHVTLRPIIPRNDLITFLRDHVDVLYVPMSSAPEDRLNMELSFPSKLTDYTAVGLPLLIQGPAYCSAVKWAKLYPRAAEVIENSDDLPGAVVRLSEPSHRQRLANGAIAAGKECFSHERAVATFFRRLCGDQHHENAIGHGIIGTDRL